MRTALILLVSLSVVAAVPFDTSVHFPYGPFGTLNNVEHHFVDPNKALTASKEVKMANKKKENTAESMSDEHFPYQPFGARPFEHHLVSLGRGNSNGMMKNTKVASNKQVETTESSSSTDEHFPYQPFGAKPYEHHWIQPKAKKDVKMVSTNSITDLPNPDDFQEAQEAVFHAVEKVERSLFRFAKRCEQAVEHAIEEEVDTLFCNGKKET